MTVREYIDDHPLANITIYSYNAAVNNWENEEDDNHERVMNATIADINSDSYTGEVFLDIF